LASITDVIDLRVIHWLAASPVCASSCVEPVPWWLDLILLVAAVLLWFTGTADSDDVWSLLQKLLAVVALVVVLLGGRQILLELLALGVALWLPSARRYQ
jgi:hypothetical protein